MTRAAIQPPNKPRMKSFRLLFPVIPEGVGVKSPTYSNDRRCSRPCKMNRITCFHRCLSASRNRAQPLKNEFSTVANPTSTSFKTRSEAMPDGFVCNVFVLRSNSGGPEAGVGGHTLGLELNPRVSKSRVSQTVCGGLFLGYEII